MKLLIGLYYVEVKDHRYKIHPIESIILGLRDPPQSLRTQYQEKNITQIRINQKVKKNDNDQLVVKKYPIKKQPIIQQPKFKSPNWPSCKRNHWLEFDKGWHCQICEYISNEQKHHIDNGVLRQDQYFSARSPHATKNIREMFYSMANTTYNSKQDMIN